VSGISTQESSFIQSASANTVIVGISEQSFQFNIDDISPISILDGVASMSMDSIISFASALVSSGEVDITFTFIMTPGKFLWLEINASVDTETWSEITNNAGTWAEVDAQVNTETWSEITHNTGTWTEVDAGGTIETWKKVA